MEEYETQTKQKKIERRVFIDAGRFVIYGYEEDGKMTKKIRIVLKGEKKKSYFLIGTGKGKNLAIDTEYDDQIHLLKDRKSVRIDELLSI